MQNGRITPLQGAAPHDDTGPTKETSFGPSGFWAFPRGTPPPVRRGGRAGGAYSPHIWAGYERCRSARAFEARLRSPSGSKNHDRSVSGRPARPYEAHGCRCSKSISNRSAPQGLEIAPPKGEPAVNSAWCGRFSNRHPKVAPTTFFGKRKLAKTRHKFVKQDDFIDICTKTKNIN